MSEPSEHTVRMPEKFCGSDLVECVDFGLYSLIAGYRPETIDEIEIGERKAKRVKLSAKGSEYLAALLNSTEFNSKTEIINTALAYLSEQPAWIKKVRV